MKKVLICLLVLLILMAIVVTSINIYVKRSTKKQIKSEEECTDLSDIDCIIVLGAAVWGDKPSPMLEDRLLEGIALYNKGVSKKIIMSGDHGTKGYDEVNTMKEYAIEKGIPSEDIFMDHAGFATYDSIYRAKEVFGAKKVIIVTQEYHLYRALHIANSLGLEAYGVGSDPQKYAGQTFREIREILARNKDFVKCIFKPKPTYLGDAISLSGNGDSTNDKGNTLNKDINGINDINDIDIEEHNQTNEN